MGGGQSNLYFRGMQCGWKVVTSNYGCANLKSLNIEYVAKRKRTIKVIF